MIVKCVLTSVGGGGGGLRTLDHQGLEIVANALPLREDFEEYHLLFQCLTMLLQTVPNVVLNHLGVFVKTADLVLTDPEQQTSGAAEAIGVFMTLLNTNHGTEYSGE
eukprot:m.53620 g.53620  ORF g.53620 m.53620 type:complete len:107 (+) comp6777_c0_seq2:2993-3313(+)